MASNQPDLKQLEVRIQELHKQLQAVAGHTADHATQATGTTAGSSGTNWDLWLAIHKPGWTSVQDVALTMRLVEAMQTQARALEGAKQAVIEFTGQVSE